MESYKIDSRHGYASARKDLERTPPTTALGELHIRLELISDRVQENEPQKLACTAGCSWCCYYSKVAVNAVEVFPIVRYVRKHFSEQQLKSCLSQARQNAEESKSLTEEEYLALNQKCLFLQDDRCSIYPVRPVRCRTAHSMDVEACKKAYEEPESTGSGEALLQPLYVHQEGEGEGFFRALAEGGYDNRFYDLTTAFLEAFFDESRLRQYKKKRKAFRKAKVV